MWFKKKKLWAIASFSSSFNFLKSIFGSFAFYVKLLFIIWFASVLIHYSTFAINILTNIIDNTKIFLLNTVSDTFWEEFVRDEFWQINVLLLGYDDWYLADTIIVSSYDEELWSMSFLSIPRDLYIENLDNNYRWRINWLLPTLYYRTWDLSVWLNALIKTVSDITWINVDYYALIDFDWFVSLVDHMWWVDIDVPYRLDDPLYPTPDWWYQRFVVEQWLQTFDWAKALKYARSRQTTSDFSRAIRQQLLIEWLIKSALSTRNVTNVSQMQLLYWELNNMLETNISFRQVLWSIKHVSNLNNFHTFVLTAECDRSHFTTTDVWCFLYYPRRDLFWWQSVLLQQWWSPTNVSYYKDIQDFAFFVLHNQKFLLEWPDIKILNWIDRDVLRRVYWRSEPVASNLAIKLKQFWFKIIQTDNSDEVFERTIIYVDDLNSYNKTIDLLRIFIEIDEVRIWHDMWAHMEIILWNNFINR